jgi:uncharacterized surface protein with fasciclin (FAS1) repeats
MHKLSATVQKFAVLAGAASAFVALPVLAEKMQTPCSQTQSSRMQDQAEAKPMTPSTAPAENAKAASNIVEVAASNGSFNTLVAALKAAGLDETLASGGPYTVFAPTDKAFEALPEGTVEELLKPENRDTLVKILTYHVVSGNKTANTLESGQAETLAGMPVDVKVTTEGVMVNNANVVQADVQASNGVIHVIDRVILPPAPEQSSK